MTRQVGVLVVDDSPLCAEVLRAVIEQDARMRVVGVAHDGLSAIELARSLRPAIVTMDVHMPKMNGLSAIEQIMHEHPTRILVVTADPTAKSGTLAFEALRRGAADLMIKPRGGRGATSEGDALRARIWDLVRLGGARAKAAPKRKVPAPAEAEPRALDAIAIVASTGGPAAVARVLAALPRELPCGVLVVQHLTRGFAPRFAEWLARMTPLGVRLAQDGDRVEPGAVLLAPDDAHLVVDSSRRIRLDRSAAVEGHRPSGTLLLSSVAQVYGARAVGVVMTGMGRDGVDGLRALRSAGGATIAQDEGSSVVYGMPRAAHESGAAMQVLELDRIGPHLRRMAGASEAGR